MIYCVEDDPHIRELVIYTLGSIGMQAEGFDTPSAFWCAIEKDLPKLILLDIMLPEEDGLSILKKLRANQNTKKVPVILLTAKDSEYDKIKGLDIGADDYVAKPFGVMELVARIKAVLRRTVPEKEEKEESTLTFLELQINKKRHEVHVANEKIILTRKEFEMLLFLVEHKDMVVTRDQFLNAIWGYDFDGENRTIDVHVRALRQKLGQCGNCIETVRGVGYKFKEHS